MSLINASVLAAHHRQRRADEGDLEKKRNAEWAKLAQKKQIPKLARIIDALAGMNYGSTFILTDSRDPSDMPNMVFHISMIDHLKVHLYSCENVSESTFTTEFVRYKRLLGKIGQTHDYSYDTTGLSIYKVTWDPALPSGFVPVDFGILNEYESKHENADNH